MKVKILGTEYEIIKNAEEKDYPQLKKCDGFTDFSIKKIVVAEFDKDESSIDDLEWYKNKVLRHEIVHAFIHESGLAENCDWARNEELTDWIAIQFTKMLEVFIKVGAIEIVFPINNLNDAPKSMKAQASLTMPIKNEKSIVDEIGKAVKDSLNPLDIKIPDLVAPKVEIPNYIGADFGNGYSKSSYRSGGDG